jgi:GH25 family lysozyme M1 (1,4-beta-N-acetylmuramidase)
MKTKLSPQDAWWRVYDEAFAKDWTFRRAASWFFCMYHYWPPTNLAGMPRREFDWYRSVQDVPLTALIAYRECPGA